MINACRSSEWISEVSTASYLFFVVMLLKIISILKKLTVKHF
jgi:hypothetical protein